MTSAHGIHRAPLFHPYRGLTYRQPLEKGCSKYPMPQRIQAFDKGHLRMDRMAPQDRFQYG